MAAITAVDATQAGQFLATKSTLSADDTITFDPTKKQMLVLDNDSGSSKTLVIDGDGGSTVNVPGLGSVSVASGLSIVVANGEQRAVVLSSISYYCQGVVHLTGAAGLKATLFNL